MGKWVAGNQSERRLCQLITLDISEISKPLETLCLSLSLSIRLLFKLGKLLEVFEIGIQDNKQKSVPISSFANFFDWEGKAHVLVSRLPKRSLSLRQRSVDGVWLHSPISFGERSAIIVRASSDLDAEEPDITNMPRESAEEALSVVENLPLESKQQMILEQRQKMKLAKKIRLRRKRLLRKRRLRKKGRWPPSKMRKLKNV